MWKAMTDAWIDKLNALTRPKRLTPQEVTVSGLF
jgi:hypothetical protein